MGFHQSRWSFGIFASVLALSPSLLGFTPATSQPTLEQTGETLVSVDFPESPGGNGPGRTAGAGTRGECWVRGIPDGVTPMTVLMPNNNLGTTADADPQLYLYIPKSKIDGGAVSIFDPAGEETIYEGKFDVSNKPSGEGGIIKLNLKGANLEPGKTYEWIFAPFCFNEPSAFDSAFTEPGFTVAGRWQRQNLTPEDRVQLEQATTPKQKAEVYAKAGLWNETLKIAEELRRSDPGEWRELLSSVELPDDIIRAPYFGEAQPISLDESGNPISPAETDQNSSSNPVPGLW